MIVKVCGLRDPDNIRAIEQTGTDWMGFVFFPPSARYVAEVPDYLPERCKRVGVFVNESTGLILQKAKAFGLHYVQLHGKETPEQCRLLKTAGTGLIKAFSISGEQDLQPVAGYAPFCDYFLFDTACPGHGGSGKAFDWKILDTYRENTPFLLSGGISPDSIEALMRFGHPRWAGIDLNSGFETAPAQKDASLIHTFIQQLKQKIQ